jgi:RNA polymerase II-associated factor 1
MSAEQDEQDQIDEINNSFIQANSITLSKLKHPTNPKLTAVEMVPIFPDFEFWPNSLALATFDNSPISKSEQDAIKMETAVLRAFNHDDTTYLAYYVPTNDAVSQLKRRRAEDDYEDENVPLSKIGV